MADLELTLDKAMAIANRQAAPPDIKVLGLLSAALILIESRRAEFDDESVWNLLMELSEKTTDSLAEACGNG